MTRIVVLPADETACGYYRMRLPAGAVGQIRPDWEIEVYRPSDVQLGAGANGELWAIHGIPDPDKIDLLVMQRTGTPTQVNLLRWANQQGIATILDVDDAMWCIDRDNSSYKHWRDKHHLLDQAAQVVDLVTCTTPVLEKRYGPRAEVIPNCVPAEISEIESIRDSFDPTLTIGWAGFVASHPHDLQVMGTVMNRIQCETGCMVRVIGDAEGAMRAWDLPQIEQVKPVPLGAPYYTALTSVDIAVVPLANTKFNQAKSYLKALEFAAVGVPVIASSTPANWNLRKTVPIDVASTPVEWYTLLSMIIQEREKDQTPRRRGLKGHLLRQAVQEHHTYEGNAHLWAAAWERALNRRERMR